MDTPEQPMLYVTRTTIMNSDEIAGVMEEAFEAIGSYLENNEITPVGPPLAVYRDWDGETMEIDVGFPVETERPMSDGSKIKCAIHRGAKL